MSWSALSLPPGWRPGSYVFLVVDPKNSGTLYAANNAGLFKSTDRAASWSEADTGLTRTVFLHSLAIDPKNPKILYLSAHRSDPGYRGYTSIGGTAPALFKSTDAGSRSLTA